MHGFDIVECWCGESAWMQQLLLPVLITGMILVMLMPFYAALLRFIPAPPLGDVASPGRAASRARS